MIKPQPITEVYVHLHIEMIREIMFNATPDALEDFREFGTIRNGTFYYTLYVSGHYDFNQVLEYIKSKEAVK